MARCKRSVASQHGTAALLRLRPAEQCCRVAPSNAARVAASTRSAGPVYLDLEDDIIRIKQQRRPTAAAREMVAVATLPRPISAQLRRGDEDGWCRKMDETPRAHSGPALKGGRRHGPGADAGKRVEPLNPRRSLSNLGRAV